MTRVTVGTGKSYDVLIGRGLLQDTGKFIRTAVNRCTAAVITDDLVDTLYEDCVCDSLKSAGFRVLRYVFPHGEASKSLSTYADILAFLAQNQVTRSDILVALGGGVTGDLTGFCAASYLRGIRFVQIPTTFLAAVDSSVGGKTGVNLEAGKNLVGAFWQPSLVLCDCDTFATLSPEIFADGAAETIKYGVIADRNLFASLQEDGFTSKLTDTVTRCVQIKSQIVSRDEFDTGERQLLNFGHTVGHAIEKQSQFSISHGHAVAIGMMVVSRAAEAQGLCAGCAAPLEALLKQSGLPTVSPYGLSCLLSGMASDKKRSGNTIQLVVPAELGRCVLRPMPLEQLRDFLSDGFLEKGG